MRRLRVPIAYCLTSSSYVFPIQVRKEQHTILLCPVCNNRLMLRSKNKVQHFAHVGVSTHHGETLTHFAAKNAIAMFASQTRFQEACSTCGGIIQEFTLDGLKQGQVEVAIGAYVVDVFFADANIVVEICHTHPVEKQKWEFLIENVQEIIEVNAQQVLDAVQTQTFTIRCKRAYSKLCSNCDWEHRSTCSFCCRTVSKNYLTPIQTTMCCMDCAKNVRVCSRCHIQKTYKRDVCFTCGPACDLCGQGIISNMVNTIRCCQTCYSHFTLCIVCLKVDVFKRDVCVGCANRVTNLLFGETACVLKFCLLRKLLRRKVKRMRREHRHQRDAPSCCDAIRAKRPRRILDPNLFRSGKKIIGK